MMNSSETVPVIDLTNLDRPETRLELDRACREWGFLQVVEHGIDPGLIDALRYQTYLFFAMPKSFKREIERTGTNPWGYYDQELTKNTLDWKEIFDYGPQASTGAGSGWVPQWPTALPEFRRVILDYYAASEALAGRLLGAISANLGMPEDYLLDGFAKEPTSFLRLNHYPVCPRPERPDGVYEPRDGFLGLNRHTDSGALTLLLQDSQPGLEVYHNGNFSLVEPIDGALVVNIGDMVQVWSNDIYMAALHRVVASESAERFSIPFFFNPAYETNYQPLPSTITTSNPCHYRPINWGDFRSRRVAGDFADVGEEIQINHFRMLQEAV